MRVSFAIACKGSRNVAGTEQSLHTNLRLGNMSNPAPKQTKAKSSLIVTYSRQYDNYYYSITTYNTIYYLQVIVKVASVNSQSM